MDHWIFYLIAGILITNYSIKDLTSKFKKESPYGKSYLIGVVFIGIGYIIFGVFLWLK